MKKFSCITICVFPATRPSVFPRRNAEAQQQETRRNEKLALSLTPFFPSVLRHSLENREIGGAVFRAVIDRMSSIVSRRNAHRHDITVTSLLRLAADWQLSALYTHDFLKTSYINHVCIPYNLSA